MKKILFTVGISALEALGTVTRMVAVADEVKKAQPDVVILFRAAGREAEYVKRHSYKVQEGYRPYMLGLPRFIGEQIRKSDLNRAIPDIKSLTHIIKLKGLLSKEYVEQTFTEEMKLVEESQPDCIVGEFDLIMPIVAKETGIPYFCTGGTPGGTSFIADQFPRDIQSGPRNVRNYNRLLRRLCLPQIKDIREMLYEYHANGVIVPSIPELEEMPDNQRIYFVGSTLPESFASSSFTWKKQRPIIYVYLSHSQLAPPFYEKVLIETFANFIFDVIVTAGGHTYFKQKGDYNQGNVYFRQLVPSDQLLKMADIAIHHGGQNSTVQCIVNEVPALIFPGRHFERHFNAKKAAEIGCAFNLDGVQFNREDLKRICAELIKQKPFQKNLAVYSRKIIEAGGASRVAKLILEAS